MGRSQGQVRVAQRMRGRPKEQNIGIYGYIGTWILRKYRKISVDILTKISVMQKFTKIL